jgi:hypothetical protein
MKPREVCSTGHARVRIFWSELAWRTWALLGAFPSPLTLPLGYPIPAVIRPRFRPTGKRTVWQVTADCGIRDPESTRAEEPPQCGARHADSIEQKQPQVKSELKKLDSTRDWARFPVLIYRGAYGRPTSQSRGVIGRCPSAGSCEFRIRCIS